VPLKLYIGSPLSFPIQILVRSQKKDITRYLNYLSEQQALQAGADVFLRKPIKMEELVAIVQEKVGREKMQLV